MPKSTIVKKIATKATVVMTVIVYFTNSLFVGQRTFFISLTTFLRNAMIFFTMAAIQSPSKNAWPQTSFTESISSPDGRYEHCTVCKICFFPFGPLTSFFYSSNNFDCRKWNRLKSLCFARHTFSHRRCFFHFITAIFRMSTKPIKQHKQQKQGNPCFFLQKLISLNSK